ncbi:hypothetical protein CsSME_00008409 [Camellia sinensis var. sinensis]
MSLSLPPSLSLSRCSNGFGGIKIWPKSQDLVEIKLDLSLSLQFRSPETSNLALPTLSSTSRDVHIQI